MVVYQFTTSAKSRYHLSTWEMFEGVQREVELKILNVAHVETGKEDKQKLKWRKLTNSIKKKKELKVIRLISYLRCLAYNKHF